MSWTNTSQPETSWANQDQSFIHSVYNWDGNYNIEYMTYNGYYDNLTSNFVGATGNETGWNTSQPLTITDTQSYPIGLLLTLVKEVTTVTNYEDTWDNITNNETAWTA